MNAGIVLGLLIVVAGLAGLAISVLRAARKTDDTRQAHAVTAPSQRSRPAQQRLRKLTVLAGVAAAVVTGVIASLLAISTRASGTPPPSASTEPSPSRAADDGNLGSQDLQPPAAPPSSGDFGDGGGGGFGSGSS